MKPTIHATIERTSPTHILALVEKKGRVFSCRYAAKVGQEPTIAEILADYQADPKDFRPHFA